MADRHLEIRFAIEQGQGDVANWIRDRFGFSAKTARRDLTAIKRQDPAWWKRNVAEQRGLINGRSAADGITPERPELREAIAGVVVLEKLTGGMLSIAHRDTSRAARQTERLLTREDEQHVRVLRRFIQIRHQPTRVTEQQTVAFATLVQAHLQRVAVDVSYMTTGETHPIRSTIGKAHRALPRRRLGPICLFHAKRAWYLLALVLDGKSRGELRQFKLARFERIELTNDPFDPPESFDLDSHLQGAWELFNNDGAKGRQITIEIVFDSLFRKNIEETMWHPTQRTEPLPDGGMRFTATVNGFEEILWWILQMGSHAHVVSPPELQRLVATELQRTLAWYPSVQQK